MPSVSCKLDTSSSSSSSSSMKSSLWPAANRARALYQLHSAHLFFFHHGPNPGAWPEREQHRTAKETRALKKGQVQRTGKRERLEAPTEDRVLCPIQNIIKPVGLPYSEGIAKEDNQRRHSDFVIAIFFFFFRQAWPFAIVVVVCEHHAAAAAAVLDGRGANCRGERKKEKKAERDRDTVALL